MTVLPDSKNGYLLNYEDQEQRRMHLQHDLIKSYMGQLILAPLPVEKPHLRVLDSGTFNGLWLKDASTLLKNPTLVGTDVSPTAFPADRPANTEFHVQSISDPWPAEWRDSFDLVHQKLVIACVPPEEGRQALYRLVELAKPQSGWVQFTEGSLEHLTPEQRQRYPVLARFQTLVADMLPNFGWNPRPGKLVRQWLEEYGLEEVQEKVMEIPIGAGNSNPKLGEMAKQNMLEVVANFRQAATRLPEGSAIRAEDFDPILKDIKVEFETIGGILRFNTVWGRRP
ncbi:N-methyltransferase gliN [Aspergillus thermomutatus]|uniref:Methyltransferase domain-containing protein n=1 Tax=Aspergillus thermomutatus TaxID=41047 RepID=A0A397G5P5_ASPTH|nr:uncharacterized protein CDV56_103425 [Aspergillus thermomutatus]RHZ44676.1 hypothetical protein CDV56_103425 [Aspergillus thermomutatus]